MNWLAALFSQAPKQKSNYIQYFLIYENRGLRVVDISALKPFVGDQEFMCVSLSHSSVQA